MNADVKFILVDDDNFNNILHDIVIKSIMGEGANVETFTEPEKGLEFIQKTMLKVQGIPYFFST